MRSRQYILQEQAAALQANQEKVAKMEKLLVENQHQHEPVVPLSAEKENPRLAAGALHEASEYAVPMVEMGGLSRQPGVDPVRLVRALDER